MRINRTLREDSRKLTGKKIRLRRTSRYRELFNRDTSLFELSPLKDDRIPEEILAGFDRSERNLSRDKILTDRPLVFFSGLAACLLIMFCFGQTLSAVREKPHWIDGERVWEKVVDPFYIALSSNDGQDPDGQNLFKRKK